MQKLIFSLSLSLLVCATLLPSCKKDKYEDQFVGTWNSTSVKSNGQEISSVVSVEIALQSDFDFVMTTNTTNPLNPSKVDTEVNTGKWSVDEETKKLTLDASNSTDLFITIVSVTETTLSVSYKSGGATLEMVLTK